MLSNLWLAVTASTIHSPSRENARITCDKIEIRDHFVRGTKAESRRAAKVMRGGGGVIHVLGGYTHDRHAFKSAR